MDVPLLLFAGALWDQEGSVSDTDLLPVLPDLVAGQDLEAGAGAVHRVLRDQLHLVAVAAVGGRHVLLHAEPLACVHVLDGHRPQQGLDRRVENRKYIRIQIYTPQYIYIYIYTYCGKKYNTQYI